MTTENPIQPQTEPEPQAPALRSSDSSAPFFDVTKIKPIAPWNTYPLGTRAAAIGGGHWHRVAAGWKWNGPHGCGSTFPTPGADVSFVLLPNTPVRDGEDRALSKPSTTMTTDPDGKPYRHNEEQSEAARRGRMVLPTTQPTHADIAWYAREVECLRAMLIRADAALETLGVGKLAPVRVNIAHTLSSPNTLAEPHP